MMAGKSFCVYTKVKGCVKKVAKQAEGATYYHKYRFMAQALLDAHQITAPEQHFWINETMREPD
jgi:hypothetical protein